MTEGDVPGQVMRAIEVIGSISAVLLGAYPMVLLLTRWFEKSFMKIGSLLKINNMAAGGMIATREQHPDVRHDEENGYPRQNHQLCVLRVRCLRTG